MALTVADIQNVSFSVERKGYDVDEVDVFLEHVADEVDAMNKQIAELEQLLAEREAQMRELEAAPAPAPAPAEAASDASQYEARIAELEAQLAEKSANDNAIAQALIVAQRSADEVVSNARAEAAGIIRDADEEADRIIGKAETDRQKIAEAIKVLETDREDVRSEYREMLSNFLTDAQRKLAEIDGDARRANVAAQARADENAAAYAPNGGVSISVGTAVAAAAAEQPVSAAPAAVAKPDESGFIDKDFSGFGAADADFEFDDID